MKNVSTLFVVLAASLLAASAMAGDKLSIRLVEGGNKEGSGDSAGLEDVVAVLKRSIPQCKQFALLESATRALPADGWSVTLGKYKVTCAGDQKELKINVRRGHKQLLSATVSLKDEAPVIVGGFPIDGDKKHVLVFVAK